MLEKMCTKCKEPKTVDQFTKTQKGYISWCKPCMAEAGRARRAKERETKRADRLFGCLGRIELYDQHGEKLNDAPLVRFDVQYKTENKFVLKVRIRTD